MLLLVQNYYDVLDMFHTRHVRQIVTICCTGLTGLGQIVDEGVAQTGCLVLVEDGAICGCIRAA